MMRLLIISGTSLSLSLTLSCDYRMKVDMSSGELGSLCDRDL